MWQGSMTFADEGVVSRPWSAICNKCCYVLPFLLPFCSSPSFSPETGIVGRMEQVSDRGRSAHAARSRRSPSQSRHILGRRLGCIFWGADGERGKTEKERAWFSSQGVQWWQNIVLIKIAWKSMGLKAPVGWQIRKRRTTAQFTNERSFIFIREATLSRGETPRHTTCSQRRAPLPAG